MAVKNPAGFHSISVMEIAFPFHELLWLQFRLFWPLYAFQCRALCMTSLKPTLHQWAPCVGRSSTAVSSCKSARLFQGSPCWVIILHQTTQLGRTPCCSAQASQVPLISSLDWGWKQQQDMLRHRAAPQPICRGSSLPSISNNTLQIQPKSHQHFILELDVRARNTSLLTVRVNRNEFWKTSH